MKYECIFIVVVVYCSCERHARAVASDFAKSCVHYVNTNLPENVRATVSHRDFMKKFIECFSDNFETEFSRRRIHHKVSGCLIYTVGACFARGRLCALACVDVRQHLEYFCYKRFVYFFAHIE